MVGCSNAPVSLRELAQECEDGKLLAVEAVPYYLLCDALEKGTGDWHNLSTIIAGVEDKNLLSKTIVKYSNGRFVEVIEEALRNTSKDGKFIGLSDLLDIIHTIVENLKKGKELFSSIVEELICIPQSSTTTFSCKLEAIKIANLILEECSKATIKYLATVQAIENLKNEFPTRLADAGDYELEASLSEAMFRIAPSAERVNLCQKWFPAQEVQDICLKIKNEQFETGCRKFLNSFNESLEQEIRVFSYPCISASLGKFQLSKPKDKQLSDFWVDINMGSKSISFFVDDWQGEKETSAWEIVVIATKDIEDYRVHDNGRDNVLILRLTEPAHLLLPSCPTSTEKYAKIVFSKTYPVREAVDKLFKSSRKEKLRSPTNEPQKPTKTSIATFPLHLKAYSDKKSSKPYLQSESSSDDQLRSSPIRKVPMPTIPEDQTAVTQPCTSLEPAQVTQKYGPGNAAFIQEQEINTKTSTDHVHAKECDSIEQNAVQTADFGSPAVVPETQDFVVMDTECTPQQKDLTPVASKEKQPPVKEKQDAIEASTDDNVPESASSLRFSTRNKNQQKKNECKKKEEMEVLPKKSKRLIKERSNDALPVAQKSKLAASPFTFPDTPKETKSTKLHMLAPARRITKKKTEGPTPAATMTHTRSKQENRKEDKEHFSEVPKVAKRKQTLRKKRNGRSQFKDSHSCDSQDDLSGSRKFNSSEETTHDVTETNSNSSDYADPKGPKQQKKKSRDKSTKKEKAKDCIEEYILDDEEEKNKTQKQKKIERVNITDQSEMEDFVQEYLNPGGKTKLQQKKKQQAKSIYETKQKKLEDFTHEYNSTREQTQQRQLKQLKKRPRYETTKQNKPEEHKRENSFYNEKENIQHKKQSNKLSKKRIDSEDLEQEYNSTDESEQRLQQKNQCKKPRRQHNQDDDFDQEYNSTDENTQYLQQKNQSKKSRRQHSQAEDFEQACNSTDDNKQQRKRKKQDKRLGSTSKRHDDADNYIETYSNIDHSALEDIDTEETPFKPRLRTKPKPKVTMPKCLDKQLQMTTDYPLMKQQREINQILMKRNDKRQTDFDTSDSQKYTHSRHERSKQSSPPLAKIHQESHGIDTDPNYDPQPSEDALHRVKGKSRGKGSLRLPKQQCRSKQDSNKGSSAQCRSDSPIIDIAKSFASFCKNIISQSIGNAPASEPITPRAGELPTHHIITDHSQALHSDKNYTPYQQMPEVCNKYEIQPALHSREQSSHYRTPRSTMTTPAPTGYKRKRDSSIGVNTRKRRRELREAYETPVSTRIDQSSSICNMNNSSPLVVSPYQVNLDTSHHSSTKRSRVLKSLAVDLQYEIENSHGISDRLRCLEEDMTVFVRKTCKELTSIRQEQEDRIFHTKEIISSFQSELTATERYNWNDGKW